MTEEKEVKEELAPAKNIFEALHRVMSEVGYVEKTGKYTVGKGYKYASERDLIAAIRPSLVKHGVLILPQGFTDLEVGEFKTKSGSIMQYYVGTANFLAVHVASGTQVHLAVPGSGADTGDKGAYQAQTGAMKYVLRNTFVIETGDDPDQEQDEERTTTSSTRRQPKKDTPKKEAEEKVDPAAMKAALAYKVPDGQLLAGTTFAKLLEIEAAGPSVLAYLAGLEPNGESKMFEPESEEDKKVHNAAKYVATHNEDFKKVYKEWKESLN